MVQKDKNQTIEKAVPPAITTPQTTPRNLLNSAVLSTRPNRVNEARTYGSNDSDSESSVVSTKKSNQSNNKRIRDSDDENDPTFKPNQNENNSNKKININNNKKQQLSTTKSKTSCRLEQNSDIYESEEHPFQLENSPDIGQQFQNTVNIDDLCLVKFKFKFYLNQLNKK